MPPSYMVKGSLHDHKPENELGGSEKLYIVQV